MPPGREVATGVGPGLGHLHPSTARVRVNSHRAPGLRLVQKAPTLAGEACEQRVLRAAEASREDGSRCWVSVGITEFSGHLEPVRLGGVEKHNGLIPTHMWWLKIKRDISATKVPLEEQRVQPHTRFPRPGFQCQEEKAPQNLELKISRNCS